MSISSKTKLGTISDFIAEFEKSADTLKSEGTTSHPSKSVNDNLYPIKTGPLFADNSAQVKKDQGAVSVDSQPKPKDNTNSTTDNTQLSLGLSAGPTGHDVPTPKAGVNDPGSSHPARVDNDQLNGGKYAAYNEMPLEALAAAVKQAGDLLLGDIIIDERTRKEAAAATVAAPSLINDTQLKIATDNAVINRVFQTIKSAQFDARNVLTFAQHRQKQADGGMPPGAGGGAMMPPPPPSADPAAGGAGDASVPPAGGDPAAGGMPPGGDHAGGAPPDASGAGSAAPTDPAELMALLKQLGITPEELQQAIQEQGAAGGAPGGDPAAGGMPPGGDPAGGDVPPPDAGAGSPPPPQDPTKMAAAALVPSKEAIAAFVTEAVSRSRQLKAANAAK